MKQNKFFFWQPQTDYLRMLSANIFGQTLLVVLNYFIWIFLFYISYLLVKANINIFWQLLFATLMAEIIEKYLKSRKFWQRPMFIRHDLTPPGLVDKWYKTGSFPSGHTIKATYFLLFCLQYQIFSPELFLLIVLPLLFFRILIGFHYPIDVYIGVIFGLIIWFANNWYTFPPFINQIVKLIFTTVFRLPYAG
jgi:membrane-associated phospholipid phosphatase